MATENPIRMSGSNERWSNSRPVSVPNRSGSAPPTMEGSFLAVDNLLTAPSYSSKHSLNRVPSPPVYYPVEYQFIGNRVGRFRGYRGLNVDNSPIPLSQATLSTHKEVVEDETLNCASDRKNGLDFRLSPGSQVLADSRQDGSSSVPYPQQSGSNSSNGEMNTADEGSNFTEISDDAMVKDNGPSSTRASIGSQGSLDESTMITKMKNTKISGSATVKYPRAPEGVRPERQQHQQQNNVSWVQGGGEKGPHSVNNGVTRSGQFHYGRPYKLSGDGQPVLQSSGFTPPQIYSATQMTYLTPPAHVYNMQSPPVYSPQYGYGAYTNMIPQFGYPSHVSVPLMVSPDLIPQFTGPSAGSVVHGGEMQYGGTTYVPPGQPSFPDPMYMQYCPQAFGQMDQLAPNNQKSAPQSQKDDPKYVRQIRGLSNSNTGRTGMMSQNYYGVQPNMGIMVQYLPAQLGTPPSPASAPYIEAYPGWQPQGSLEGANGPRLCNFLQELKSGKGRRFNLSDITGHIVEFSADQHGSRFIQQKLENCNPEEKAAVFKELLPHACKLMTDVFGNYVIQKFFEYGNSAQRKELADQLMGHIVPLSLQMYGCRVIQKALDVIEPDQRVQLASELDGQVLRCVRDQNGNHVIQKCIQSIPADRIGFLLSAFCSHVSSLSMHPYGCRVIQRLLERCSNENQCRFITEEILESVCVLSKDQYGNYVTQHVLEKGTSEERGRIVRKLSGHIIQLSLHKFASNVIEKCLEYGGRVERDLIIKEIAGADESYDSLLMMMKDQYGNYVVQKIFETCTVDQRVTLLSRVRMHAAALKKYTYGKHIVTRLEQPFGEGRQELR